MKKFSKILESSNNYYKVEATIELLIQTENEGEAGYIADSILSSVENSSDYTIINIDRSNISESFGELYHGISDENMETLILNKWVDKFGEEDPTTQEKYDFYSDLRSEGIDGILIFKVLKNKI